MLVGCAAASGGWATEPGNHEGITKADVANIVQPQFSPYAGRNYPTRVLFGDTHLHTAISVDAGTMCRVGQEDAFRFARGEEVASTYGLRVKLSRPLEFLVISDHAEMYGLMPQLLSGDRKLGGNGKLPAVGNTVDVAKATWKNTIGAPELSTTWTDPDFDAKQPAFYYARVIEIPTPRWTAYEAQRFGIKMPADVPMTTQERAYTSPIWYSPEK